MLAMATELKRSNLLLPRTPARVVTGTQVRSGVLATMFAISIPIAFVSQLAYLCWIAIPFIFRAVNWMHDRRDEAAAQAGLG